jgi:3-hydroxyisobutyrate dehydrogenase
MNIALLGTGAMGSRVAQRLLRAGHVVAVYNRTPSRADALVAAGARRVDSARAAVTGAEIVIAMVTDDAASRALWLDVDVGAAAALSPGVLVLESSTLSPAWVRELGSALRAAGARMLDAPVVGSRPQAESGALIYLLGGSVDDVETAAPLLQSVAGAVHHVGEIGAAATAKLAINALFATQVAALAEWRQVLDDRALDLLATGGLPVMSGAAIGALGLMRAGKDAPLFPIALVAKDLRYAVALSDALPVTRAVGERFAGAVAAGHGEKNITAVGG